MKSAMKSVKFMFLMATSLLLSSCNDPVVTGSLTLSQTVNMLKETNNNPVPVEIAAGEYKAVAKLRDKNTTLYLAIADGKSNPTVKFDLPVRFPNTKGEFTVTPKEGGQPYGLHGIVKSQSQDSKSVDQWESCSINCMPGGGYPYPPTPNCNPNGMGYQRVRFHIRTTQTQYDVDLVNPDKTPAGAFHATGEYSDKVYEYKGYCM
jgi:hypothetical protein